MFELLKKLFPYILFVVIWQVGVVYFKVPNYLLPSPSNIFHYMVSHFSLILTHLNVTVIESVCGLLLSVITTIMLGLITLYSTMLIKFIYKILLIIQIVPLMAIAPLIVVWFGFGIGPKIFIVFIICLFPCVVSFLSCSFNTNKDFILLLRSMGAKKGEIFKLVIFPSSCYGLFSGLKIAVTYSVTGAVIAEYIGAEKGLGVFLVRSFTSFNSNAIFANIICLIFTTLIFYNFVLLIEKALKTSNKRLTHEKI